MCGRFYIDNTPEMQSVAEAMNRSPLLEKFAPSSRVVSRGEIRPSDVAPVIASAKSGRRAVFPMKWGFTGKTMLINARSETAAVRPLFREAWRSHRCAVPASWYDEWEHLVSEDGKKRTGDRFSIRPKGASQAWLCGLYRMESGLPCFVILTREPADQIRFIHDRMPLMLPGEYVDAWIRPDTEPETLLGAAVTDLAYERRGR